MVLVVKNLPAKAEDLRDMGWIPVSWKSPVEGMATHSIIILSFYFFGFKKFI